MMNVKSDDGVLHSLPLPVVRALRKLGQDLRDARRRRRIPTALMAERASISRGTLNRVEKGSPQVGLGTYATVIFVLGMIDRLADIADSQKDTLGHLLEEERLPERIRSKRATGASDNPRPGRP